MAASPSGPKYDSFSEAPSSASICGSASSVSDTPISTATTLVARASAMNWTRSSRREAPSTLRTATSRARTPARAVARLTPFTTASSRVAAPSSDMPATTVRSTTGLRMPTVCVSKCSARRGSRTAARAFSGCRPTCERGARRAMKRGRSAATACASAALRKRTTVSMLDWFQLVSAPSTDAVSSGRSRTITRGLGIMLWSGQSRNTPATRKT